MQDSELGEEMSHSCVGIGFRVWDFTCCKMPKSIELWFSSCEHPTRNVSDNLQVGKWGVTANVVTAISDALEANELIKVHVSGCPSPFSDLCNSICPE
jgi:hypothetical protein